MSSSLAASAHASHRLQDQQAQRTRTRIATGIFAVLTLSLAVVPMATSNISFAFYLMLWVTMASAMNICVGFTGYLPFGFVVFYGVGAYATGICYKVLGWPILPSLAAASVVGLLIALLFAPTLRLRGVYFGIVSLALATIMRLLISNLPDGFTGGSMGLILSSANSPTHSYYAMLAVMAATLATVAWLSVSRLGKALKAIRDDDAAAACVIEAWYTNVVDPEYAFHVLITAKSIIYAMAGGFGTIIGPVVGTLALLGIDHLIWQKFPVLNLLLLGLVIVLLMLFLPRGIVGSLLKRYPQLRQYIA